MTKRRGFTLIEILVVLGIVAILAAILLPVLNSARAKARQAACASNMHQLGLSVAMYAQDFDGLFPRGGDPTDLNTDSWDTVSGGQFSREVKELPPLMLVMRPYVKSPELWRCPADTGFDITENASGGHLNARPTCYEAFGTSYFYRTELTLRRKIDLAGYEAKPPHAQHGPEDINVFYDGVGLWHGDEQLRRYNTLFADGHVKNITAADMTAAWNLLLDPPDDSLKKP